ncbi:MAG: glycine zipper 2TM domain-containing protein [Gammaproteobacteria bacterium]|nr:glycine zipper 2TM domain-containing protein [Gammaproteobacteria bacterium]
MHINRNRLRAARHTLTKPALLAAVLTMSVSTTAFAADRHGGQRETFTDYARVVNVEPIYGEIAYEKPHRECWLEEQHHVTVHEGHDNYRLKRQRPNRSVGDTLAGGVIGGVIGNQLGRRGSDGARVGATVVGAIIGSALANESSGSSARHRRHRPHQQRPVHKPVQSRPVERCTTHVTTEYKRHITAYQVTYRYKGQTFTTRTEQDPGDRIPVRISIRPIHD